MSVNPLSDVWTNMFPHSVGCLLFCWWFSLLCKTFLVCYSPACLFFHLFPRGDISDKIMLWAVSDILLPMLSSRIFMLSGLIFRSLIYFEFIVCGVRRWSSVIFLHVSVQFSQHHLLNWLSLPHCMFLPPLSS